MEQVLGVAWVRRNRRPEVITDRSPGRRACGVVGTSVFRISWRRRIMNRLTSRRPRSAAAFSIEPLERRALLAATISGAVFQDISGNGLSADDKPLAGVTVNLYKDVNANGKLDATDGAAIATKVSAAVTGAYAFAGLTVGKYLVEDVAGSNQVRTWPLLTNTIAINVTSSSGTYANNNFANYIKNFSLTDITNVSYLINGTKTVTTLAGNVKEGDTVKVTFTVKAGKTAELTLVSYKAASPVVDESKFYLQKIYQVATGKFTAGTYSLTVKVPDCYFQLDFIGGKAINQFGPVGSNLLYGKQGRLISFAVGGTKLCDCMKETTGKEGLTPGFWKNHPELWQGYSPNQTLESVFNVPDALGLDNVTLLQALSFGGGTGVKGAAQNLFRHAVAAILNAAHIHVDYALTTSQIISQVNTALASNNASTINTLKDLLDKYNNAGGGIDAHGKPI
jgi:hypothetical protein